MPKKPFHSVALTPDARLAKSIQRGAIVVGRGHHEMTVPEISWSQTSVFSEHTSFAAKLLKNLRNQKGV